jgi:AcrR family transcriptional regulator
MPERTEAKASLKSEETRDRIIHAALTLFRERGFEVATMRDIAEAAGVANGAAYYYFPSKEAIVLEFYRRSGVEIHTRIESALQDVAGLEQRLGALIRVKLSQFAPNRAVLRALLRNGADPNYPLSPFSPQTSEIRDADVAWFRHILVDCGIRIPKDLQPRLPGILWFFQMGIILFWVIDDSPDQARTERLLQLSCKSVAFLVRASALPLMRPLRKAALEMVEIVAGP